MFLDRQFHVHQRSVLLGAGDVGVLVREELASTGINTGAVSPVYTAEQRKTVRQVASMWGVVRNGTAPPRPARRYRQAQ